jgi:hypothetical protein
VKFETIGCPGFCVIIVVLVTTVIFRYVPRYHCQQVIGDRSMQQSEDEKNSHSFTVTGVNEECINNKFNEELTAYFPFAVVCV